MYTTKLTRKLETLSQPLHQQQISGGDKAAFKKIFEAKKKIEKELKHQPHILENKKQTHIFPHFDDLFPCTAICSIN